MTGIELKKKFIEFMESKGHKRFPSSSVLPENDPSALFINSGMHPIVPFLLGQPHPAGVRITNYQRAIRTGDIENVGVTRRHLTFFEMMGEWSLGDYWKRESLVWSMEFLVNVLKLDPKRLYATVFIGNELVERDNEAIEIWKDIFNKLNIEPSIGDEFFYDDSPRIIMLDEDNFWKVGNVGPCGPCSEIFYDTGTGEDAESRYIEVCNNVFMAYFRSEDGKYTPLKQQNIDVGWGYERLLSVVQNLEPNGDLPMDTTVFETDVFSDVRPWLLMKLGRTEEEYKNDSEVRRISRAILDHIRAATVIIADGVLPSNKDQGYILRRLIRRAVTLGWRFTHDISIYTELADKYITKLDQDEEYKHVIGKRDLILQAVTDETKKFESALKNGIKELDKIKKETISGEVAFRLKEAFGLPLEITQEIAEHSGKEVDTGPYFKLMEEHQEKSRAGGEKKFVGGLGDTTPESIRYHTCAHLFLASAQKVLGDHIHQKGQNITPERLRYDISHPKPLTNDEIKQIENDVNRQIERDLTVDFIEVALSEAKKLGAEGVFDSKYEKMDKVKVYRMYDSNMSDEDADKYASIEICGGPHVENTAQVKEHGKFKIAKEESSSGGVRRIKGILVK